MKSYESNYCSFSVPDDWEPIPPFGFSEPGDDEARASAQAFERWLSAPKSMEEYRAEQRRILPEVHDGFELVEDYERETEEVRSGCVFSFKHLNGDGDSIFTTRVSLLQGPLLAELSISTLDSLKNQKAGEIEAIGKTFRLRNTEFLSSLKNPRLLDEISSVAAPAKAPVEYRSFPKLCLELPVLPGWTLSNEDDGACYSREGIEIRVRRVLETDGDVSSWFGSRMSDLQSSKAIVLGAEQGEIEDGTDAAAILFDAGGERRRWDTKAVSNTLQIYVNDAQPLEWNLEFQVDLSKDAQATLWRLVVDRRFLDGREWETRLPQPWLEAILRGPWRSQGPGVYAKSKHAFAMIYLAREENPIALQTLLEEVVKSFPSGTGIVNVHKSSSGIGPFRGRDALRVALDGANTEGEVMSARGFWTRGGKDLYTCVTLGRSKAEVDECFRLVVDGLRFDEQ